MNHIVKLVMIATALMTGCADVEGTVIDSRGGAVVSDDGRFTIEIPQGALEYPVDITIDRVECPQTEAVGSCYEVGPVGMPLLLPGTVVYALDDEALSDVDLDALTLITEREEDWKPLPDHQIDSGDDVVIASAVYLSAYAVVAGAD